MAISLDFLRELSRFALVMKKKVNSEYSGGHRSPQTGSGLIFQDFHKYEPGDDFRKIDWQLYARTERLFLRRYEEDRNLSIHILIDSSGSMDFGEPTSKFEYGAQLGLGFAYIGLKNNERFTFSTFAESLKPIKLRRGMNQLLAIVEQLNNLKVKGESRFEHSISQYKSLITSRSLIIIISDFLLDVDEIARTLSQFRRSELILLHVLDPVERKLALEGDFLLEDAEVHDQMKTLMNDRIREEYKKRLSTHLAKLKDAAERLGAKYVGVSTDAPVFKSFYRVLRA